MPSDATLPVPLTSGNRVMTITLCRDCQATSEDVATRCPTCGSPRLVQHPELRTLSIAHLDCDAFYAAVEKREDHSLRDRPLIVGGGRRGVVSTACYIARIRGVRSAMPMFKALQLCPEAVVVSPRMSLYADVSRAMRSMMLELTPLVEPLSLDEAFLDLSGTERLHRASPAQLVARLQRRIESELGVTASVGLSHNKFLAKIASERDKPRGFAVIGRAETDAFLAGQPVSIIWGVGQAGLRMLERDGIRSIADLRARDRATLVRRFGSLGDRLWHLSRGQDTRSVTPDRQPKSISHEITFDSDVADPASLGRHLWHLSEKVSARAKRLGVAGRVVVLKLKRADHSILSRRQTLDEPTAMADRLYRTAMPLLQRDLGAAPFRLIGVGLATLSVGGIESGNLLDPDVERRLEAERAADRIRARFGDAAIVLGRSLV